jgi:hypothetical protein
MFSLTDSNTDIYMIKTFWYYQDLEFRAMKIKALVETASLLPLIRQKLSRPIRTNSRAVLDDLNMSANEPE